MSIPPWTYSRLDSFESCPRKFYHTKVVKDIVEPPTEATKWGELVHTAFENNIKNGTPLPDSMKQWKKIAVSVGALPGQKFTEMELAISKAFQPVPWGEAWSRGKADLIVINDTSAAILDYKTGKRKPSEQLSLYALYVFSHFPEIHNIETGYVWLRDKKIDRENIRRDETSAIIKSFLPRVAKLESAYERGSWPPKPSGLCRGWCPVTSCEHYRSKG